MNLDQAIWQSLAQGQLAFHGNVGRNPIVFPGSFDPVHDGHVQMARIAGRILGSNIHPEISIANVDKPNVELAALQDRVNDAARMGSVVITRAAKFIDKARLFPSATFVIGADTLIRLDDTRYYERSRSLRDAAIEELAEMECRFLVFGRLIDRTFRSQNEIRLSPKLESLCQFVAESEFRVDLSSTEIRANELQ